MRDWLGSEWRDFEDARAFVQHLGLTSTREWDKYCASGKKPDDIPKCPDGVYAKAGWVNYGDWLGTGRTLDYLPFKEARAFARSLKLNSAVEWKKYCRSPERRQDIPTKPERTYLNDGWISWGDWLGTGRISDWKRKFRPFKQARALVRQLGLKGEREWRAYCKSGKKPADIPVNPGNTYAQKGWAGTDDWLGTGRRRRLRGVKFRSFTVARAFVRRLGLKSVLEWQMYSRSVKRPYDIPSNPPERYSEDWVSWGDWLGTDRGRLAPSRWQEARTVM